MSEKPELYQIHSLVKAVESKIHRALSPDRHRHRQMLAGGTLRLVMARPTVVSKELLERLLPELRVKAARGMLKVTTMSGQRIDLETLQPTGAVEPSPPLPNPPLDSAANDKTFEYGVGERKMNVPGGKPPTEELPLPTVIEQANRFEEEDTVAGDTLVVEQVTTLKGAVSEVKTEVAVEAEPAKPAVLERQEVPTRRRRR